MKSATYIGMQRHRRIDGGEHLRGQFDRDIAIAAGTEVLLRRDGYDYVLQLVAPGKPWDPTKRERAAVELANAPRGALRRDPRHEPEDMP